MSNAPTLINLPPPPSDPVTPSDIPGTPNSTTTSMSELSTVAIKDGHRGHLPHHSHSAQPSGLSNQLDAERADRISRLAGLERVTTARNPQPPPVGNLTPGAVAVPIHPAPTGYFDANGNPNIGRERSTVGSASATGSVGARTTWAGSEAGDMDKMSESQDMDMDTSSVGGMSEEGTPSLVGFGEGARTPARQSAINSPAISMREPAGSKGSVPSVQHPRTIDGITYEQDVVDTTSIASSTRANPATPTGGLAGVEHADEIVRDNMDTTSADRMRQIRRPGESGRFGYEK